MGEANTAYITGAGTIQRINTAGWQPGSSIRLISEQLGLVQANALKIYGSQSASGTYAGIIIPGARAGAYKTVGYNEMVTLTLTYTGGAYLWILEGEPQMPIAQPESVSVLGTPTPIAISQVGGKTVAQLPPTGLFFNHDTTSDVRLIGTANLYPGQNITIQNTSTSAYWYNMQAAETGYAPIVLDTTHSYMRGAGLCQFFYDGDKFFMTYYSKDMTKSSS